MSNAFKIGLLFGASNVIDPAFGGAPSGVVLPFAGSTAPSGWLLCFGQAVSRTTYASLFAAIGTAFGVGDGSTTFNLPDMRGRVPGGKDDMGAHAYAHNRRCREWIQPPDHATDHHPELDCKNLRSS